MFIIQFVKTVIIQKFMGILIALCLILAWFSSLLFLLSQNLEALGIWVIPAILLQTHLYTGIFITAHDGMHGGICENKKVNYAIGAFCALLFAFNYYPNLFKKHHEHHIFVATEKDPDFHHGSFWIWYFSFAKQYVTIWQIIAMAIAFNLLKLYFPQENLLLFWALPSVMSTFQLFYFGTYTPHKGVPDNKHHSRTLAKNHLLAFLSCYFFGYHFEHHDSPRTPWWKLYRLK